MGFTARPVGSVPAATLRLYEPDGTECDWTVALAIAGGGVLVAAELGTFTNFAVWSIAALVGIIAVLTVPRKKPAPTASPRM